MGQGDSKARRLKPADLKDLSNQTAFTPKEIREWFLQFKDDFPTGKLKKNEFREVYSNLFPEGDASQFAEHVFQTFDANGDGTVDFREFICALSVTQRGSRDDKLRWAFKTYDLDHDGNITRAEMLEILTALGKMSGETTSADTIKERMLQVFNRMDVNHDSKITLEEFVQGARNDPALMELLQC